MPIEELAVWILCGGAIATGLSFNMIGWSIVRPAPARR